MRGRIINVGLIGCGTVGTGVANLFSEKNFENVKLKAIAVRNISKKRNIKFPNIIADANKIINDPEIDIVVELAGGYNPAKDYIIRAIRNGKHVVTANKAVISEHGPEIFALAKEKKVNVGFEAAVAGGIPIINPLLDQLSLGKISSIVGILNGTTNFILTRMSEGMDYETALKIAQEKGFAEADPTFDVEGLDAAQKIAILASLAFGKWINPKEVYTEGISRVSPVDIDYAKDFGYVIKLLAIARKTENGDIDARVHPVLIEKNHRLANVKEEFNAIYIQGSPFDEYFNVGKGAGQGPTAFSAFYDIVKIAEMMQNDIVRVINVNEKNVGIADQNKIATEGYLRLYLQHVPGALHSVLSVLVKHKWNIKDSIQRGGPRHEVIVNGVKCLPDIITHEPLSFGIIRDTLSELETLKTEKGKPIHGKPFYMRIQR